MKVKFSDFLKEIFSGEWPKSHTNPSPTGQHDKYFVKFNDLYFSHRCLPKLRAAHPITRPAELIVGDNVNSSTLVHSTNFMKQL